MAHFEGERTRERLKTKGNGTTLVQISTSLSCLLTLGTYLAAEFLALPFMVAILRT